MHRKSTAELLRDDLRDLVDAVVPDVESAVHNVAEKAPPLIHHGRAAAMEKGALAATSLARRIPDPVLDRLPDTVSDRIPQPHRRRGRALVVLGVLGVLGAAAAVVARRRQAPPERPVATGIEEQSPS
ncbi:hypothetical protein ACFFOS_22425 [Nocardioides kongjuensis]|uniref:Uncharacterized protein n=1 Tax=Nocardioides kongjuensis TaxID=349522 RepID=A0A852RFI7_9ACTN|nr:hypothetical protein [Nocardioides kongjuensis]NYD29488.1 hypothetical protein [Nocardioides kongjuensis]